MSGGATGKKKVLLLKIKNGQFARGVIMANFKKKFKAIMVHVWETIKSSFLAMLFYGIASSICFMGTLNTEWTGPLSDGLTGGRVAWVVIAAIVAAGYNGIVSFANGGKGYEMLVSGNMKRLSAERLGSEMKISAHKECQEYRDWKGFAAGGVVAVFTLLFGILMGANADGINEVLHRLTLESTEGLPAINTGTTVIMFVCLLLDGWALIPFVFANLGGATVSYYWGCLFAIIPVAVSGAFYIIGAYAKRSKTVKAQAEADRAAAAEANKPKKINYGGLPGTKPKKKRK